MINIPLNTTLNNRYRVVGHIARGGMGAVYKATDQHDGSIVALKQLLVSQDYLRKAFEREARILFRLRHPSLPMVSDFFAEESGQFMVMQFIPGADLGTLLQYKASEFTKPQIVPWIMRWADELLDALDYLHTQPSPIIHRDIKPQNLKTNRKGNIVLLDFGIAKSAQDQTIRSFEESVRGFTRKYAPLEQIQALGTNARSDLYALGATLYHLMTGVLPPDAMTRLTAVVNGEPDPLRPAHEVNPHIAPSISFVIHQAMEQKNEERFSSAASMRVALQMAVVSERSTNPKRQSTNNTPAGADNHTLAPTRASASAPAATPARMLPVHGQNTREKPTPPVDDSPNGASIRDDAALWCVVDQRGLGTYRSIGDALLNAQPGTRIRILPGCYEEDFILEESVDILVS